MRDEDDRLVSDAIVDDPALEQLREAVRLDPRDRDALAEVAWILATSVNADLRDAEEAVRLAEQAAELSGGDQAVTLDTLAAAYAAAGRFDEAVATARRALELGGESAGASAIAERLRLYSEGEPYRE